MVVVSNQMQKIGKLGDGSVKELLKAVGLIFLFVVFAIFFYNPGIGMNGPSPGWSTPRSTADWGTPGWDWDWIDCMYFAMVTMTTVGYGDMPTLRQGMRLFTLFFGFIGVACVSSSITVIADWFAERGRKKFIGQQRTVLQEAMEAGKLVKAELEKENEGKEEEEAIKPEDVIAKLEKGEPISPEEIACLKTAAGVEDEGGSKEAAADGDGGEGAADGKGAADASPRQNAVPPDTASVPPSPPPSPPNIGKHRKTAKVAPAGGAGRGGGGPLKQCCMVLKALRLTGFYVFLCLVLGELENSQFGCAPFSGWSLHLDSLEVWKTANGNCWSLIDELYYAIITFSTIGYGDVSPKSKGGKALGSLLVVMGVLTFSTLIAEIMQIQQAKKMGGEKTLRERISELKEVIEQDDDGTVSPEEYIIFNLKKMGKADEDTISLLRDQFGALDADGSGELDDGDIEMLEKACAKMDSM